MPPTAAVVVGETVGEINVSVNSTNPSSLFQAFLAFQFCSPPSAGFSSAGFCVYHLSAVVGRHIVALDGGEHERGKNKGCNYM